MMFLPLQRLSLAKRLILVILFVASVVSIAEFIILTAYYLRSSLESSRAKLRVVADIVGLNSVPALRFHDRNDASELLRSLDAEPSIRSAYLFDASGGVLSEYLDEGENLSIPLTIRPENSESISADTFEIWHNIVADGQRLGTLYIRASLQDVRNAQREGIYLGSFVAIASLGLAFALAHRLQKSFSGPVASLSATMADVTNKQDYSVRAEKTSDDELGLLVDSFNHMLKEIDHRGARLSEHMLLLERTNKELDQFVYIASHDLKAPLRAVENLARMIARATAGLLPADKLELIQLLQSRVKRMELLLDDLLQYSRVGRIHSSVEKVDTAQLIAEVVELLAPPEGFSIAPDGPLPVFAVEKIPFEQVMRNLINNAVKHHHRQDGNVRISARELDQFIEFSICDDGPGIAPQFHERIFQMFQTLKPRDEVEGSGMGLALVKKIVTEKGGMIRVDSAEGSGSCFVFTWPKSAAKGPEV